MPVAQNPKRKFAGTLLLAVALFIVGISTVAFAQGTSFLDEVINAIGRSYAERLPVPTTVGGAGSGFDENIGAIATTTGAVGWVPNVGISETVRYGTFGIDDVDSRVVGQFQKDCTDATSTVFSFQNTTGKQVAITELVYKLTGSPTTTVGISTGTSTRAYVDNGGSPNPYTDLDNIGLTAVMDTFIIPSSTPTGTMYFMSNYPGINRQTGFKWQWSGTGVIGPTTIQLEGGATAGGPAVARGESYTLLEPGDFILGYASTTVNNLAEATDMSAVTSTNSIFNCSVYGEYTILN